MMNGSSCILEVTSQAGNFSFESYADVSFWWKRKKEQRLRVDYK